MVIWIVAVIALVVGFICGFTLATRNHLYEINRGFLEIGGQTFKVTENRGRLERKDRK